MGVEGAGASAAARAASIRAGARRGLWRRVLAWLGLDAAGVRAGAEAARWEAGAIGEQRTAHLLAPLAQEGWYGLYDRALPGGGRANADHVLVPPCGRMLVLVDSKLWSRKRGLVGMSGGRLVHGMQDRGRALEAILYEAHTLERAVGVRVVPMVAVHSAPVVGGRFTVAGVEVLEAPRLVGRLRALVGMHNRGQAAALAHAAASVLPRYEEGGR